MGVLAARASKIIGQLKKNLKIEFPKIQLFNEHLPTNLPKLNYKLVFLVMSIRAACGRGRGWGEGGTCSCPGCLHEGLASWGLAGRSLETTFWKVRPETTVRPMSPRVQYLWPALQCQLSALPSRLLREGLLLLKTDRTALPGRKKISSVLCPPEPLIALLNHQLSGQQENPGSRADAPPLTLHGEPPRGSGGTVTVCAWD